MHDEKIKGSSSKKLKDAIVMNEPFLKLYINNNDGNRINRTNQALSTQE